MVTPHPVLLAQMGHGEDELEFERPKKFQFFTGKNIAHIACGGMHTIAVGDCGRVWTWGCNDDGALGRSGDEDVPMIVNSAEFAKEVIVSASAGDSHTCVLTSKGRVWTWGTYKDSSGSLGFSSKLSHAAEPVLLEQLPTASTVRSGSNHSIAVTVNRQLYTCATAHLHHVRKVRDGMRHPPDATRYPRKTKPDHAIARSAAPQRIYPHRTASHSTTPHNTTSHHTTPHHTTQHNTTQHNTAPHSTAPHYTTPHRRFSIARIDGDAASKGSWVRGSSRGVNVPTLVPLSPSFSSRIASSSAWLMQELEPTTRTAAGVQPESP